MVDFIGYGTYEYIVPDGRLVLDVIQGSSNLMIYVRYASTKTNVYNPIGLGSITIPYKSTELLHPLTRKSYRRNKNDMDRHE